MSVLGDGNRVTLPAPWKPSGMVWGYARAKRKSDWFDVVGSRPRQQLLGVVHPNDEGVAWIRGHFRRNTAEVKALLAAYALSR